MPKSGGPTFTCPEQVRVLPLTEAVRVSEDIPHPIGNGASPGGWGLAPILIHMEEHPVPLSLSFYKESFAVATLAHIGLMPTPCVRSNLRVWLKEKDRPAIPALKRGGP